MDLSCSELRLVNPPQVGLLDGFSSGLLALASYVRRCLPQVDTRLLDYSTLSAPELQSRVAADLRHCRSAHPVVGVTTTTASYQSALAVSRAAKSVVPNAVVVLGGHHASPQAELILDRHRELVDAVIVGEGERGLENLLLHWPSLEDVPNVAYRSGVKIVRNRPGPRLSQEELDLVPVSVPDMGIAATPGKFGHTTYVSARGCPLRCAFCAVSGEPIRAKTVDRVVEDVRKLVGQGFSAIAIEDNFFAHSRKRTSELCEALSNLRSSGVNFRWDCQTRIESIARGGVVAEMRRAGCEAVYLGVEALSEETLIYLGKTTDPARYLKLLIETAVPLLMASGVQCYLNLQLGVPEATQAEHRKAVRHLQTLGSIALKSGSKITIFPQLHVIYPGTRHFAEGLNDGLFASDVFEGFTAWEADQQPILRWLGEHFAHGTGGLPIGILEAEALRQDRYRIDSSAVLGVATALSEMERIPGIEVFRYGDFLVASEKALVAGRHGRS